MKPSPAGRTASYSHGLEPLSRNHRFEQVGLAVASGCRRQRSDGPAVGGPNIDPSAYVVAELLQITKQHADIDVCVLTGNAREHLNRPAAGNPPSLRESVHQLTIHPEPRSSCARVKVEIPSGSYRRGHSVLGHWSWRPLAVVADQRPYDVNEAASQRDQRVDS